MSVKYKLLHNLKEVHIAFAHVGCRVAETNVQSNAARPWSCVQELPQACAARIMDLQTVLGRCTTTADR